ncbi:Not1-domain-containing protein [Daldinia caldariorum]|uniref:Not1-domain-containing protein n=1 Tax=Daldinia caldariorum TaxID=326644 RepID=UPI002008A375|nr:Not1-domain-containing protein [Daldinia caldariorum]KAI1472684.1 Not1-domain-containing protein [Daldinia caldariorum]
MVPPPSSHSRSGTFSPAPAQNLQTGLTHSPHPSQTGPLSAGASPSTSSPTAGNNSLTKIVVAQVYLLLSTIKEDKDRAKWELQVDQLKKLLDDHGMEVFSKYFTRLVAGNAPQIFPGINRPVANPGNYSLLVNEMAKISHDLDQASRIAESIESANEDIFRDFDLSTFMEHFKLDALEKTILALAFKFGSRQDLKTKADAILSTNFPTFVNIISRTDYGNHSDLTPSFIANIVDRYIQGHPPNFNSAAKHELSAKVQARWLQQQQDQAPPMEVLAALDLIRVLGDKPPNALALYIQKTGTDFTRDEETCLTYLQSRPSNIQLSEEQVSAALTYTTVSLTYRHNPSVLVAALRRILPQTFRWHDVVAYFDQRDVRVSSAQFLRLYQALLPIAQAQDNQSPPFSIQSLWGGSHWENPETQLSFICAFASLSPDELDASTIPGLQPTFTLDEYAQSPPEVRERAAVAVKHPLVSALALSAIFQVALHSLHASQSTEAKRLFQEVVVPNLDIFIVSAFGVPKPWPPMAVETLASLFDNFLHRRSEYHDFVLDSLWRKDRDWVTQRLVDAHAMKPMDLTLIFEHVIKHGWLDELVYLPNGFGYDLAALAHAEGHLDLAQWAHNNAERSPAISQSLLQFLMIKANLELQSQRGGEGQPVPKTTTPLHVKTVLAMLQILEDFLPRNPLPELIIVQRACITSYPRLINYGEGYDDIIDANGKDGNGLPPAAIAKMEEHYKKMYGEESEVKYVVQKLEEYKHSRFPLDQDIFACMIHGLFDEYSHFIDYPLEALATTAVLFGGIISHKLISELPLKIGLGMILEAVRDHTIDSSMYKFGLQALIQIFPRFREWPGLCKQLLQIPGLRGTEAYRKAEEVVREDEEDRARAQNGTGTPSHTGNETLTNGAVDGLELHAAPFAAVNIDPPPPGAAFEDPVVDVQDRIQFGLNNLTSSSLQTTFREIHEILEHQHQQWFASHLVEERAKMQPNYHQVYLDLVKLFQDTGLWSEVLRQTYISVARMLNSESTLQNSTDRTHLKYLGAWLGLLTIARDQPIKHKNIAFKQLLIEAHDTKRLVVVVPFVCKVLIQASKSTIFRPPNPWLMDIIHLLIELYHHAELKLNQKFEIEVLCKDLNLDHKSIEPSTELQDRVPVEEVIDIGAQDPLEHFENMSLNGMAGAVPAGITPHPMPPPTVPDISGLLQIPPTNEMVINSVRLHEIVRTSVTKALQDIIQPVVDRSVTIAAISTQQMIHKDFATEPDENKLRTSAINMVKATAGSLAQVTSKEPLRANITNYMRNAAGELPHSLPEGTIIMCVNSNLELACNVIEKQAEERAVPEIEEMIEGEIEARRRHRLQRPNEPYVDPGLSRWAMTIPHPYKLSPNLAGLNAEQMAIYEDFARQPRGAAQPGPTHGASTSDATRNIANEVLQDQYSSVPTLATPAETSSLQHLNTQLPYSHVHGGMTNGRPSAHHMDGRGLIDKVERYLSELKRTTTSTDEEHFSDLPRSHPVLEVVDMFTQLIINTSQNSDEFAFYAAEKICQLLFSGVENTLFLESLVHILEQLLKIAASSGTALHDRVQISFYQQSPQNILNISLITALLPTDFLDLHSIDHMLSRMLVQREEGYLEFFDKLLDLTLFNERPIALFADFVRSLEVAWDWINENPELEIGQRLKSKFLSSGLTKPQSREGAEQLEQFDYIFDEWVRLHNNYNVSDKARLAFVKQIRSRNIISNKDEFVIFTRRAIDMAINYYEQVLHAGGSTAEAFVAGDALVKMVIVFARESGADQEDPRAGILPVLEAVTSLFAVVLNHHHVARGEHFNQRVFFRLFSMLLHDIDSAFAENSNIELCRREFLNRFSWALLQLNPERFPGFAFAWLSLIGHRRFMPDIILLESKAGWISYTKLLKSLLRHVSAHMKAIDVTDVVKEYYRAVVKHLVILAHDFTEYMSANAVDLCSSISPHCTQLRNIVLNCGPRSETGELISQDAQADIAPSLLYLRQTGISEILQQLVQAPPSEDAIAHLTHAINKSKARYTTYGNVPLGVNCKVIDAIVTFFSHQAIITARQERSVYTPGSPDVATLSLLVHELQPEGRYFLISSMVDRLRNFSPVTEFFSYVIFEIFGQDLNDPEEADIRQQVVRVLLERIASFWPQPFGLTMVIMELITKDKYHFFDQPFIKADRDIADQFMAFARQHNQ